MNLVFKITNLAIFFIVVTIVTIVATISKILSSSQKCRDKPKYTHTITYILIRQIYILYIQVCHDLSATSILMIRGKISQFRHHFEK